MTQEGDDLARRFEMAPFHQWLGLRVESIGQGVVALRMPYRPELRVTATYLHGGVLATLLDIAGDLAVWAAKGMRALTVDLRVDYLQPAAIGEELRAEGRLIRAGRSVCVAEADVRGAQGVLLAAGRGLWRTIEPPADRERRS